MDRTDLEADQLEQTAGADAQTYENRDGAQTGTNRAPDHFPDTAANLNTESDVGAHSGHLSTRTPGGSSQGITTRSSDEESARQQKVVKDREDAQAGVTQNIR